MIKNLLKDFLRDVVRSFSAWLNTENGRAFKDAFKRSFLESSVKARRVVKDSMADYHKPY